MTVAQEQATDLLATLAEIEPGSALAQARETRDAATLHIQGSYNALFNSNTNLDEFPLAERLALAQQIARWHGDIQLGAHYAERLNALTDDASTSKQKHQPALAHAERLTFKPANATAEHLAELASRRMVSRRHRDTVTIGCFCQFPEPFTARLSPH